MDQEHTSFTRTISKCVLEKRLHAAVVRSFSNSGERLCDLHDRVIGQMANSALCAQFEKFSISSSHAYRYGIWWLPPANTAEGNGQRVKIGVFGKLSLEIMMRPEDGKVR